MVPVLACVAAAALALVLVAVSRRDPRTVLPDSQRLPLSVVSGVLAAGGSMTVPSGSVVPLVVCLAAFGTVLGAVDLRTKLLPNALLLRFAALTLPLLLLAAAATGTWGNLLAAMAGAAALFTVYFVLALVSPSGMGMGDVKLAGVLGLFGGWAGAAAWMGTLLGGFLLGGLVGLVVLATRRGSRGSTFPFGPGMLAAAFTSFVLLS